MFVSEEDNCYLWSVLGARPPLRGWRCATSAEHQFRSKEGVNSLEVAYDKLHADAWHWASKLLNS